MPDWVCQYNYILKLDMTKMLKITNAKEFEQFNNKYKVYPKEMRFVEYIDWKKVALKYGGIEINPYLWEKRLCNNSIWYYGWDCASGCIWDKKVILNCLKMKIRRKK